MSVSLPMQTGSPRDATIRPSLFAIQPRRTGHRPVRTNPSGVTCRNGGTHSVPYKLSSSLVDRHEFSQGGADVLAAGADEAVVGELLDDVGRPPGHSAGNEQRRVDFDRQAEQVVGDAAGEVFVEKLELHLGYR